MAPSVSSPGELEELLLGHHLFDFWTNLCICHNLITEESEPGCPPIYQVRPNCIAAQKPEFSGTLPLELQRAPKFGTATSLNTSNLSPTIETSLIASARA